MAGGPTDDTQDVVPQLVVTYKGTHIIETDNSVTKTLETAGKYCEDDIIVKHTPKPGETRNVTPTAAGFTVTPTAGHVLESVTVAGDTDLIPNNVKKGVNIFGVIGTVEEGIVPSGVQDITENGTYDVTKDATATVAVRNGTNNRHYEVTNPTSISGGGNYLVIATDSILATVRTYDTLQIVLVAQGVFNTDTCTKRTYATNIKGAVANSVEQVWQETARLRPSGDGLTAFVGFSITNNSNPTNGSGRVYITESGELRWYSNTNLYPILSGEIIADVWWGDD